MWIMKSTKTFLIRKVLAAGCIRRRSPVALAERSFVLVGNGQDEAWMNVYIGRK